MILDGGIGDNMLKVVSFEHYARINKIINLITSTADTKEKMDILSDLITKVIKSDLSKIDKELFEKALNPPPHFCKPVTADMIIEGVAKVFKLNPGWIYVQGCDTEIILGRRLSMYLMKTEALMTTCQIANVFNIDESEVKASVKVIGEESGFGTQLFNYKISVLNLIYPKR